MNERAALEGEERLAGGRAVVPVLLLGVAEGRAGRTVLQLGRRHGQAMTNSAISMAFSTVGCSAVPDDRQEIGPVVDDQCHIQPRGRLEEAQAEPDAGDQLDAVAQHAERAAGLQGLLQLLEELGLGGGCVLGLQLLPFAGLSLLHEPKNQRPVDGERPVVILRLPWDIALRGDQSIRQGAVRARSRGGRSAWYRRSCVALRYRRPNLFQGQLGAGAVRKVFVGAKERLEQVGHLPQAQLEEVAGPVPSGRPPFTPPILTRRPVWACVFDTEPISRNTTSWLAVPSPDLT